MAIKCNFIAKENDENYPTEIISELLKFQTNISLEKREPQEFECEEEAKITFSFKWEDNDYEYEEQPTCDFREKTSYPKVLNNVHNMPRVIVNQLNYRQSVKIRECNQSGCLCSASHGTKAKCKQYHESRDYLIFDEKTNELKIDQLYYPSECRCVELIRMRRIKSP